MLDRLKGPRSDQTEPERKRDEARVPENGDSPLFGDMPRFQPQPGGFGRRVTPVAATPVAGAEVQVTAGSTPADAKPAGNPLPQFPKPEQRPIDAGPVLGDIPTRIADWLMRELKDQRGVHCETMLTAVGALAGYAAQQALWEGMVKPGKLAIAQAFKVVETSAGETFFFGDALDTILASMEPKHHSIWKIVAGNALAAGGEHLPDIANLFRYCEASAGTSRFGLPRLPDDHLPSILPRVALERFWPGARLLLALAEPLTWPLHMAYAAQKLMLQMKGSIAPDLAVKIVMEAAVPMSRVDPTTVPNN
ncbi:MAG TPA: hypothetical protein VFE34_07105 [Dongiaceae bacterium]|jgi:hypothetical protein|nr:hypothetical protein [Dongiaceae bacterium]